MIPPHDFDYKRKPMEIKRKFEGLVATNRRYIIRQSPSGGQIPCAECGEPMLATEQAGELFGIKQRRIFRIIEAEAAHFIETEASKVLVCLTSLALFLNDEVLNDEV